MSNVTEQQEELMDISRQWAKSKSPEEMLSYWTDNALFITPGQPTARGKQQIGVALQALMSAPGFAVDWEPQEAVISDDGTMGYLVEKLALTMNDATGNPATVYHQTVTIWKQQPDGQWKCEVDVLSVDPAITSVR